MTNRKLSLWWRQTAARISYFATMRRSYSAWNMPESLIKSKFIARRFRWQIKTLTRWLTAGLMTLFGLIGTSFSVWISDAQWPAYDLFVLPYNFLLPTPSRWVRKKQFSWMVTAQSVQIFSWQIRFNASHEAPSLIYLRWKAKAEPACLIRQPNLLAQRRAQKIPIGSRALSVCVY